MQKIHKNQNGQSLIETAVALGTAVIIVTSIASVVLAALNNAQFSKNQNIATQLAQQGMETLRQMRTADFTAFSALSGAYCLDNTSSSLTQLGVGETCGQNVDIFSRSIKIVKNEPTCGGTTQITVNTAWSDGKCRDVSNIYCHAATLISCLSDVPAVLAP